MIDSNWVAVEETGVIGMFNEKVYALFMNNKESHMVFGKDDTVHSSINFANESLELDDNTTLEGAMGLVETMTSGCLPGDVFNVMFNIIKRLSGETPRLHLFKTTLFIITEKRTVMVSKENASEMQYIKDNRTFH